MSGRKKHLYKPFKNRFGHPFASARSVIGNVIVNGRTYDEVHVYAGMDTFMMTLRSSENRGLERTQPMTARGLWEGHTYTPCDAVQLRTRVNELIAMVTEGSPTMRMGCFKFADDNFGVLV
jgi:hypothetical protein